MKKHEQKENPVMNDINPSGDFMFNIVPLFIGIIFVIMIIIIIVRSVGAVKQWNKNEQSPKLTVPAVVKTKRTKVNRHIHSGENNMGHVTTTYFVTMEFDSGDRSEFKIYGKEFGQLAEGDVGMLHFQGTRFLGFERSRENT